jgi:hypothetical protein
MAALEKNRPYHEARVGRFRITLWRRTRTLHGKRDYQTIWCQPDDLRDLVNALDKLNDSDDEKAGAVSPVLGRIHNPTTP